ncbi:hypothetical protein [Methanothrix soehngenii]|uniref:hypothetical protein n=1 Tax=Methanothrix soehngenii TaxID=2223 RepID=UPI002FDF88BB
MDTRPGFYRKFGTQPDVMIDLQKDTLSGQETLIEEVRQSRKEIKGRMDQRFDKLESEVAEMKVALKSKGII